MALEGIRLREASSELGNTLLLLLWPPTAVAFLHDGKLEGASLLLEVAVEIGAKSGAQTVGASEHKLLGNFFRARSI